MVDGKANDLIYFILNFKTMDLARHCSLCEHQKVNLKNGTTCKITDKKPEFNSTCSKINLKAKFEEKIKQVNIAHEKIKRTKTLTYIYCSIFLIVGLSTIYGGYYLGKYVLEMGVISTVPLIIMGIGCAVLPIAIGPFNNYRNKLKITSINKQKLDEVLALYHINYAINIIFGKEIHGNQEVTVDLKVRGIN